MKKLINVCVVSLSVLMTTLGQGIVQAEFESSSNTIPQIRLTSLNGNVNEMSTNDDGDFVIFTNGVVSEEKFRIVDDNGFVGINTSNPPHQLTVTGNSSVSGFHFSTSNRIRGNSDGIDWSLGLNGDQINRNGKLFLVNKALPTGPDDTGITFTNNLDTSRITIHLSDASNPFLDFSYNNALISYIRTDDGSYNIASDKRLKKNITDLENVLDRVNKLEIKSYHYNRNANSDNKTIGLIAQDVQELFPEVVSNKREFLAMNYSMLGTIALKAVQEHQQIIDRQHKTISTLKSDMENAEARIKSLEMKMNTLLNKR